MKSVNIGQQQTDTYESKGVCGIMITVSVQALLVNVVLEPTDFAFRQTTVDVTLHRNGKPHVIVSTTLDVLMKAALYSKSAIKALWSQNQGLAAATNAFINSGSGPNSFLYNDSVVQEATATAKDIRMITIPYHFAGPLELTGDDKLKATVNATTGTIVAGGNADPANTTIYFSEIECDEVEKGIPETIVTAIQQNQGTVQIGGGRGCKRVLFVNTDRQDITIANSVIASISYRHRNGGYTLQYSELLNMRSAELGFWADVHLADFELMRHQEGRDGVNFNITMNTINVTASNNYVIVERIEVTPESFRHYTASNAIRHNDVMFEHGFVDSKTHSANNMQHSQHLRGNALKR